MKVGFDDMQKVHFIDEVIFDLSFVSTSVPDDHEAKVSAWITEKILPAVDSVLNEFDETETVLCLNSVEIDLGEVTEDAFQTMLVQRLKERLNSVLHGIRENGQLNSNITLPLSRVSYAQADLKQLQFFLMTGQMTWHVSTSSRQAHEKILERVLREKSDAFIQFLKQSTAKNTLINRMVKQFTEPYLVRLLQKIVPIHAALTLNLLKVYRATITEKRFSSATIAASIDSLWVSIFDVALDKTSESKEQAVVVNTVVEKLIVSSAPDSADLMKKMQRVATRLKREKKIDAALLKILTDVRERRHDVVRSKGGRKKIDKQRQKAQESNRTTQYQRIIQALKTAKIVELHLLLKGLRKHPAKIRERLAAKGKQAAIRVQLAEKLTDDILLDITGSFMPVAVSYIKQLLAQSSRLHQGIGEAAWKRQLWESNLNYLFAEPNVAFIPVDYLQSLARLMSPTHDAQSVLRVWHAELSTTTNTQPVEQLLANLLQQLVVDENRSLPLGTDQHPSDSDAYKTLVQRLQQDTPPKQEAQSLQPMIAELAQEYPQQCQRIYEAIRSGTISTANLSALEQQQLLIAFIDQAPVFDAESRTIFIQAITSHAEGAADKSIYYQQILQTLLHNQPVDLEAAHKKSAPDTNNTAAQRLETKGDVGIKKVAAIDRIMQYQRIVQALEEMEIVGFYPLPEGLQQHPVMIRRLLAEQGKQATTRQQLAVKLTDKILIDITDLFIPAAVSYIEQLLARSSVLHQGVGEVAWKQQLWESNLSYLFAEPNVAFIPADYLKALASLMSPTNDAQLMLVVWHQKLFATMGNSAEHTLVNFLRQLIVDEDSLLPLEIAQHPLGNDAYQTLVQRLQCNAPQTQEIQSLQAEITELAQEHPQQCQRIYEAIRNGTLSTTSLNVADQQQLLTSFIDQAPAFNTQNRTAFIQAIASHAEGAANRSTYYQLILQALLHDQPVDLVFLSKQVDFLKSLAMRRDDSIDSDAGMTEQRRLIDAYDVPVSEQDIETKAMIEINNAGQIIAAPYMPQLFKMLKLVDDEGLFVSLEAAERAVHLLQYMVDEQSESPEYLLILNKVLCGIPTAVPIRRQLSLSENEKKVVEDLILGMIQNWKTIGSTSVSGFRETFLQRDGGLVLEDGAWHLTVHPGTFDMLLDGLPWSFSIVKHAWMDKAIHVDWR